VGASKGAILAHAVCNNLRGNGVVVENLYMIDPIGYKFTTEIFEEIRKDKRIASLTKEEKSIIERELNFYEYTVSIGKAKYSGKGIIFQAESQIQSGGLFKNVQDF
jgi:thioesterase domain-containing protein